MVAQPDFQRETLLADNQQTLANRERELEEMRNELRQRDLVIEGNRKELLGKEIEHGTGGMDVETRKKVVNYVFHQEAVLAESKKIMEVMQELVKKQEVVMDADQTTIDEQDKSLEEQQAKIDQMATQMKSKDDEIRGLRLRLGRETISEDAMAELRATKEELKENHQKHEELRVEMVRQHMTIAQKERRIAKLQATLEGKMTELDSKNGEIQSLSLKLSEIGEGEKRVSESVTTELEAKEEEMKMMNVKMKKLIEVLTRRTGQLKATEEEVERLKKIGKERDRLMKEVSV